MRAFLYIGGEIDASHIDEQPEEGDLILAADSGWNNAMTLWNRGVEALQAETLRKTGGTQAAKCLRLC